MIELWLFDQSDDTFECLQLDLIRFYGATYCVPCSLKHPLVRNYSEDEIRKS